MCKAFWRYMQSHVQSSLRLQASKVFKRLFKGLYEVREILEVVFNCTRMASAGLLVVFWGMYPGRVFGSAREASVKRAFGSP